MGQSPTTAANRLDRWRAKVAMSDGCWEWRGARNEHGYGMFTWGQYQIVRAHRAGYELLVGMIPAGLDLDHLCGNRTCVRPDHLEPVTRRENLTRRPVHEGPTTSNGRKTECIRGHPLSGDNLLVTSGHKAGRPSRVCRICKRLRERQALERAWIAAGRQGEPPRRAWPRPHR